MPLDRGFLQEVRDPRPDPPGVGRVLDAAGRRHGKLPPQRLVREEPSVDRTEGDGIEVAPVLLEEQVGIGEQLGRARLDPGRSSRVRVLLLLR